MAQDKRPFSDALANQTIENQVKRIRELEDTVQATRKERDEAIRVQEGMMKNIGDCGACAEEIMCGSTMAEHDPGCVYSRLTAANAEVERLTELNQRLVRGEFTQICSYCGAFEAPPPNGWEELQAHIQVCPAHPITTLKARVAACQKTLCFFKSVIQSGEAWSATCEDEFQSSMNPKTTLVNENPHVS